MGNATGKPGQRHKAPSPSTLFPLGIQTRSFLGLTGTNGRSTRRVAILSAPVRVPSVGGCCPSHICCSTLILMRAAIYLRVSSDRQDAANQELQVRALCTARGYTVDPRHEFRVTERGDAERNDVKDACREVARRGEVDVVVVWALDRWTRAGIGDLISDVGQLKKWGVALVSVQEPWADTTDDGTGELLLAIAGWMARQEKRRLAERNKATAQRLRSELATKGKLVSARSGKIFTRLGRPSARASVAALALAQTLRALPGERFKAAPMGWPAVASRIRTELGEMIAPATLARLASKTSAPKTSPRAAQNAA